MSEREDALNTLKELGVELDKLAEALIKLRDELVAKNRAIAIKNRIVEGNVVVCSFNNTIH